jgi:hypothetical protein
MEPGEELENSGPGHSPAPVARVDAKAMLDAASIPGKEFAVTGLRLCRWCDGVWPFHIGNCPIPALEQTLGDLIAAESIIRRYTTYKQSGLWGAAMAWLARCRREGSQGSR